MQMYTVKENVSENKSGLSKWSKYILRSHSHITTVTKIFGTWRKGTLDKENIETKPLHHSQFDSHTTEMKNTLLIWF